MKNVKILLLIFSIMIVQIGNSQIDANKLTYVKGKCYYQNGIYSPKGITELVKPNKLAFKNYQNYRSVSRGATTFGVLSTGFVLGGVAMTLYDKDDSDYINCDDFCPDEFVQLLGRSVLVLGGLSSLVALVKASRAKKFLKKSIDAFNEGNKPSDLGVVPMELKIGTTQNGVGVMLNF